MGAEPSARAPIAVVGLGCLFPKAPDLATYWANIVAARDALSEVPAHHSWRAADFYDADPLVKDKSWATRGGFLDATPFDPMAFGIPPADLESIDTTQLLSLLVARETLRDAGLDPDGTTWDRSRTATILGVTGTQELAVSLGSRLHGPTWRKAMLRCGVDPALTEVVVRDIAAHMPTWTEQSFPGLLGNVVAGRIANRLDLGGTNCVVDAACGSSLAALQYAVDDLRAGRSDLALSGGADTLNDAFMFQCFTRTPALSRSGDSRPFDAASDGILIGEGIAMLALMRLADAEAQGRRIYAVLHTVASSSDGRHKSIYAPNPAGQAVALRRALADTGFTPRSIELVEAHGTGTRAGDIAEVTALREVYGEGATDAGWATLGSVKAQIGHTKSTAGAAGLVKAVLALHERVLPPTPKVETPNPKLGLDGSPFHLPRSPRPWVRTSDHPRRAAVSAFGFGGSNFHALLEEHVATPPSRFATGASLAFAVSAPDVDGLRRALDALDDPARDLATRSAASVCSFQPDRAVAAFVATDAPSFAASLEEVRRVLREGGRGDGVHVGLDLVPPKVAALFPGQGSQFVEMGREPALRFPMFRAALDAADDALLAHGHPAVSPSIFPPTAWDDATRSAHDHALRATQTAQPALGATSLAYLAVLNQAGVPLHALAGHSYGELVALHAAGVFDAATLLHLSTIRGEAMAGADRGAMIAVSAPLDELDALVAASGGALVLANRNHPEQGVLAGPREALAEATVTLGARGRTVKELPVSAAFHSPLVADAVARLSEALALTPLQRPDRPVWSNATAAPYPDDAEGIASLLATQLASPVRFSDQIEALYADGVRVFVEVGPRAVLSSLVRRCLRGRPVTVVALDAPDGAHEAALTHGLLALAAAGVPVHLDALAPGRLLPGPRPSTRTSVPLAGANHRFDATLEPPMPKLPARPPTPDPAAAGWAAIPSSPNPVAPPPALERSLSPDPAERAATPTGDLSALLDATRRTLVAFQELQERTAQVHAQFLDQADRANATFASLFQAHDRLVEAALSGRLPAMRAAAPSLAAPVLAAPVVPAPPPPVPSTAWPLGPSFDAPVPTAPSASASAALAALEGVGVLAAGATAVARPTELPPILDAAMAVDARRGHAPAQARSGPSRDDLAAAVLAAVATKTGYPRDLLEPSMDLESDLGVDSIKRVEILAAVSEALPGLPEMDNERMSALRTLAQVVDALATATGATATGATATAASPSGATPPSRPNKDTLTQAVLAAVATKTGYPRDLLEPTMDLEADLGVDSIKRVEILAAVSDAVPGLPEMDNEQMASLRTLSAVVDFLDRQMGPSAAPERSARPEGPGRRVLRRSSLSWSPVRIPAPRPSSRPLGVLAHDPARAEAVVAALVAAGQPAVPYEGPDPGLDGLVLAPGPHPEMGFPKMALRALIAIGPRAQLLLLVPEDAHPAHTALHGLARTARIEWPSTHVAAVRFAPSAPLSEVVALALAPTGLVDLRHDGRQALALTDHLEPVPALRGPDLLQPGDLVVVTGGARGVTAEVAIALGARFRPHLLLLGRSDVPDADPTWAEGAADDALMAAATAHLAQAGRPRPKEVRDTVARLLAAREVRTTLRRVRATGATATYLAVDVRDPAALGHALRDRAIVGLVHGAGVLADKRIVDKDPDTFDAVWDTKAAAGLALVDALAAAPLRFALFFGSIAGRYGNRGQVDYAMANEALVGLTHGLRDRGIPASTIAWGPWMGGMVTPELARHFAGQGRAPIPIDLGAAAAVAEVEAHLPTPVVVIEATTPDAGTLDLHLDPTRDAWLTDHALKGVAVLPVARVLADLSDLGRARWPDADGLVVDGLAVLKGVEVRGPTPLRYQWTTTAAGLAVELLDGEGVARYRATVRPDPAPPAATLAAPVLRPFPIPRAEAQATWLFHGPRFHTVGEIEGWSDDAIVGTLHPRPAVDTGRAIDNPLVDVAAFDGLLQLMVLWVRAKTGSAALPTALGTVHLHASWTGPLRARLQLRPKGATGTYDAVLTDADGQVVATVYGGSWAARSALNPVFTTEVRPGAV